MNLPPKRCPSCRKKLITAKVSANGLGNDITSRCLHCGFQVFWWNPYAHHPEMKPRISKPKQSG